MVSLFKRNAALCLSLIIIGLILFGIIFYRDPQRYTPVEKGIIISPADGKVISIDTVKGGDVPVTIKNGEKIYLPELKGIIEGNYTIVAIFMGPLDVHVNRAPISGQVVDIVYIEGGHFPAFGNVLAENERNIIVIDGDVRTVTVQIAGTLARRIDCFVNEGQSVYSGDKIGIIKLGSQVVVMYPSNSTTVINVGDRVKAGETKIAEI